MLFTSPPLSHEEREVILRIEGLRERLRHQVNESRRWMGVLRRVTLAKAIQSSNSIEGYNVTLDDAVAAAGDESPADAEGATWQAVAGYRDAMTYVLQLADDPHFTYSADLIRSLHFMMMRHELDKRPGRWRVGPNFVHDENRDITVYEGPDADFVPGLMEEFLDWLRTGDAPHGLVQGAMAHLNLVMIHPFRDGNGRMARALQSLVLARQGILGAEFCSIEEYLGDNTQDYYDVLALVGQGSWNPGDDAAPWVRFCLTAHFRQATRLLARVKAYERIWSYLEHDVSRRGLPDRAIPPLLYAATGGRVRRPLYAQLADVSDDAASRDLKACTDAALLVPHGEKRGRFYTAVPELRERWLEIRNDLKGGLHVDPFREPELPLPA